jgi:hypothetical protein
MVIFRACWVFFDILIFISISYSLCRNSDNSNPSYNGVIFNQRQKNESPISSLNSTMFQDLGFHYWNNNAGNFSSHSAYDLQLSKIKEGLSSSDSFDMNLQALDLLTSTRFSGSFPQPASLDPLDIFKDSLSFGLDSIQQSNQRPSCSPSKVRFLLPSISFSFSSSSYQQQAVSVTMAWLNGYDCILDCSIFCDYLVLYVHYVYLQLYVLEFASSLNGLANSNLSGKIIMYQLNLY